MTKYNLENFEKWLEENNEKRNLGWEEKITEVLKRVEKILDHYNLFKWFISEEVEKGLEWGLEPACQPLINEFVLGYQNNKNVVKKENLEKYQKIVKTWMDEVGQEEKNQIKNLTEQLVAKEQTLQKIQTKIEKTKQVAQENINLAKQKITALENQLISLAKQKLKGKREAQTLLTQLESNWKDEKTTWTKTEKDYLKNIQEQKQDIQQKEQTITTLKDKQTELTGNIQELKEDKTQLQTELQLHHQKIKALETQLTSLSRQKITTQQQLTQTQAHYELRKKQALFIGIIGLALILYLAWPLTNKEKEAPRTWTYV